MRALVGLSGGVDSAVAARLLQEAGHEVAGVTMALWGGRYKGGSGHGCFGPEGADLAAARDVCRALGIEHRVVDCAAEYERLIIGDFRREKLAGRTPNPCVRCNAEIKFGLLPRLARAAGLEADFFATGHYARIESRGGRPRLLAGLEPGRDQSYFLYRLPAAGLPAIRFPLGAMAKTEVRQKAASLGLAVSRKPDSQDFYSGDEAELVGAPDRPGDIVDETGRVLGRHRGFWRYTIGQRRGLGVAAKTPLYVVAIDAAKNEVTVSPRYPLHHRLTAASLNWVSVDPPQGPFEAAVKARSTQREAAPCLVTPRADGTVGAEIPAGLAAVAPGQSAVFYQGDMVLGGGLIGSAA